MYLAPPPALQLVCSFAFGWDGMEGSISLTIHSSRSVFQDPYAHAKGGRKSPRHLLATLIFVNALRPSCVDNGYMSMCA